MANELLEKAELPVVINISLPLLDTQQNYLCPKQAYIGKITQKMK